MSLLSGATRGGGGPYLARHLLKTLLGQNIQLVPSRGLAAETLPDQLRELTAGGYRNPYKTTALACPF